MRKRTRVDVVPGGDGWGFRLSRYRTDQVGYVQPLGHCSQAACGTETCIARDMVKHKSERRWQLLGATQ